jgi:uncharacterized membrane protein
MHNYYEHHKRSWAKTVTYRILIIISNGLLLYYITGQRSLALEFITWASVISTLLYFLHERVWNKIAWGKFKK